ncbi:hypothetical protein PsorP6_002001 [Peronosclerospora sorghi]|uniref:Uncharacterized protein n=1 Tax=Peronosclerospora sorghi TaxID=230839 RepID=A0ACC0WV31_9STRA|nr:hypothetical protein PsorP6_002001 [Peronosclerospora sorghi]
MVAKKDLPLLQPGGYAATIPTISTVSSSYSRVASEELIVPAPDSVNSVYYDVDAFSHMLVDFFTIDQKSIVWSSRAHRKMMTTLYAFVPLWPSPCSSQVPFCEAIAHAAGGYTAAPAVCFLAYHAITHLEVINCCHNLEIWLEEYFHGNEPILERQYVGFFPSRIDFWTAILGMLGSMLYVSLALMAYTENYGIVDVERKDLRLIVGYRVPFFAGSLLLLLSAYLAHVEVVHQWFHVDSRRLRLGSLVRLHI